MPELLLRLDIGPTVLPTDEEICIQDADFVPSNFIPVGPAAKLAPDGQTFNQPVQVQVPFDPNMIPPGRNPNDIQVLKRNDATQAVEVINPSGPPSGSSVPIEVSEFSTVVAVVAPVIPLLAPGAWIAMLLLLLGVLALLARRSGRRV